MSRVVNVRASDILVCLYDEEYRIGIAVAVDDENVDGKVKFRLSSYSSKVIFLAKQLCTKNKHHLHL